MAQGDKSRNERSHVQRSQPLGTHWAALAGFKDAGSVQREDASFGRSSVAEAVCAVSVIAARVVLGGLRIATPRRTGFQKDVWIRTG
ncbi:hypothetical protein MTO96_048254 [Rhipicephalus appendiculatus]